MAEEARDAVWIDVLPAMDKFAPTMASQLGTEIDKVPAEDAGKKSGEKLAKGIVAGVTAAGAIGKVAYDIGSTFDDMADTIRIGTDATGQALDDLTNSAKAIGSQVPADFGTVGQAVADINTRLGYTGPTLEEFTKQVVMAGEMSGEAIDVNKVSAAFNVFKIGPEQASPSMDLLWQVAQSTGVSINQLTGSMQSAAPALQGMGFGFDQAAALVGNLDKAGMNSGQMLSGMSRAMVNLAKDGEAPADAFKRVVGEIQGFTAAGDEAAALDLASKVFGTRGATQFTQAIKDGTLSTEAMFGAVDAGSDTILGATEDTADFAEQWELFKNRTLIAVEPLAERVFGGIGSAMEWINQNQQTAGILAGVAASIAGVVGGLTVMESISNAVKTAQAGLAAVQKILNLENLKSAGHWAANTAAMIAHKAASLAASAAQKAMAAAQWALNAAMNANPIALIIIAIVALVAGFIWLWNNVEGFRNFWIGVWDAIKGAAEAVGRWFSDTLVPWFEMVGMKIKFVFTELKGWVSARLEDIKQAGQRVGDFFMIDVPMFFENAKNWIIDKVTALRDGALGLFQNLTDGATQRVTWLRDSVVGLFQNVHDWVMDRVNSLKDQAISAFNGLTTGAGKALDGIREAAAKPINFVINTVYNNGLRKLVNGVVGVFGGDGLPEIEPIALARGAFMGDGQRPILWNEVPGQREAYIPINNSARSRSLLTQAASEMGMVAFAEGGIWPTGGTITSPYGWRDGPFFGHELHDGVDIGAPMGTPVVAPMPGMVVMAGPNGGYGNYIKIDHGGGVATFYGHLESIAAAIGDLVEAGQTIGTVGSTGASTGPHLHFGASVMGGSYDPTALVSGDIPTAAAGGKVGGLLGLPGKIKGFIDKLGEIGATPWAQMVGAGMKSALTKVGDWVKSKLGAIGSKFGAPGGGNFDGWWADAIAVAGPQYEQYKEAVRTVAQKESGMNPNAINDWDINAQNGTPSQGILQFIKPTFDQYMWPGYDNFLGQVDQILAFFRYTPAVYGSIWNHPGLVSMANGGDYVGYESGTNWAAPGLALVGERGPELISMRGGEKVWTHDQTRGLLGGRGVTLQVQAIGDDIESQIRTGMWALETEHADQLDAMGV